MNSLKIEQNILIRLKKSYNPLLSFGVRVYNLLVDNFSQTFFVGGMVRDLLLNKKILDIDIATAAKPEEVVKILSDAQIELDTLYKKFGVVTAKDQTVRVSITTFREDLKADSRYPKVRFVKTAKQDSNRRDFTINALYLSAKSKKILDFHNGIKNINQRLIRFIGNPEKRIKEDPLRIVRAFRFAKTLNLKIENETLKAINKYFYLTSTLSNSRIETELNKITNKNKKAIVEKILLLQKFS